MPVDHTKFGEGRAPEERTAAEARWWTAEGREAVESVTATLTFLEKNQSERLRQMAVAARLYGNVGLVGPTALPLAATPAPKDRITFNVVSAVVDTVTAKVAKNRPKPLFLTSGGDYRVQRKAKRLNRFVEGIFYENNAYRLGPQVFRDGAVFGDGLIHVYAEGGRVRYERVLSSELWVDEVEGFYGAPRQMHRVKAVDRAVLADAWPDAAGEIAAAGRAVEGGAHPTLGDLVLVRESWRLPSGPESDDGRHLITIDGAVLLDEEWSHDFFPFARFRWSPRLWGFWSQGAAERLQSIQLEINRLLMTVQTSLRLAGSFKVLVENGSKIVKEHLNNDVGSIITYTGTAPQYIVPPAVPPEIYGQIERLIRAAFEQEGVSQLSATAQKPAGLNSGKALREYSDIESDRFSIIAHAYEDLFLDLARLSIATIKDVAKGSRKGYRVNVPGSKWLQSIDWREVDLAEDQYVMRCYPVSSLPNDPAGRLQTVQEYMQAGLLSPRQGRRLLDFPDLEQVEGLANAVEEHLQGVLDRIVDAGEYTPPEPFDDLGLAREMALQYYAQGKAQGLEEERLDLLRTFIGQIQTLQDAAQPQPDPALAAMAGDGAAPQAAPMPTPRSDLLPNVGGSPWP